MSVPVALVKMMAPVPMVSMHTPVVAHEDGRETFVTSVSSLWLLACPYMYMKS